MVVARGDATIDGDVWRFELVLAPVADDQWRLVNMGWDFDGPLSRDSAPHAGQPWSACRTADHEERDHPPLLAAYV